MEGPIDLVGKDGAAGRWEEHAEEAKQDVELELHSQNLTFLPDDIYQYSHTLRSLNLSNNSLSDLPEAFNCLVNLTSLDLSKNHFQIIPKELTAMTSLERLDMSQNQVEDIPSTFVDLSNLKALYLSGNQIYEFPGVLCDMISLDRLFLGGNMLERVPASISALRNLQILYLGGNRIRQLPDTLGRLQSLTVLYLGDNRLEELPDSICSLQWLRTLSVHKNQLTMLPPGLLELHSLQQLTLRGNPLVNDFIHELPNHPLSLRELCARTIRNHNIKYFEEDLPECLQEYLRSAERCNNPQCQGVYFSRGVRTVQFVDFCGKYRVPLMRYLCCTDPKGRVRRQPRTHSNSCNAKLKRVLLTGYKESDPEEDTAASSGEGAP